MARNRRGGFRPPEVRGTLGTLLRTALQQAGGVREALEGVARQGRERLDDLRADRRRGDLVAELGELVLDLVRRGEIDPDELPEARDLIRHLDELDAAGGADDDVAAPPSRRRFDDRGGASRGHDADDGTVSSSARWPPAVRAAPPPRVWRPPTDDSAPPAEATSPLRVPTLPKDPHRKGGISFDDEDLADYMHPDDVPPKDGGA